MKKEIVSIIVPVYNAEKYIGDTIKQLLEQTYTELEIILIDDGSIDNTWRIILEWKERDERIKAIHLENGGPSKARNIGLQNASGVYVRFIDADDYVPKTSVEILVNAYKENEEVDLVIGNYKTIPEKNYFFGEEYDEQVMDLYQFTKLFVDNMKSFYFGVPWNKLYKRSIITNHFIRFDESLIWCEDLFFNLKYYEYCRKYKLVSCNEGVYTYYERENSITSSLGNWKKEELSKMEKIRFEKTMEFCKKAGVEENITLQWKYSNLYNELVRSVKKNEIKTFKARYARFKQILKMEDVYRFVCLKQQESKVWSFLRYIIEKKIYIVGFVFFLGKDFGSRLLGGISPDLKKKIKKNFPKSL